MSTSFIILVASETKKEQRPSTFYRGKPDRVTILIDKLKWPDFSPLGKTEIPQFLILHFSELFRRQKIVKE